MADPGSKVITDGGAPHGAAADGPGWGAGGDWQARMAACRPLDYEFTISGGRVIAERIVRGSRVIAESLAGNARFQVGPGTVTKTIAGSGGTEMIRFALQPGSRTRYAIAAKSFVVADPTAATPDGGTLVYDFTISGGAVMAETRTVTHGADRVTETITPPSDAIFSIGAGTITETWVVGHQVKTLTFVRAGGSTGYVVAGSSTTVLPESGAPAAVDGQPGAGWWYGEALSALRRRMPVAVPAARGGGRAKYHPLPGPAREAKRAVRQ